MEDKIIVPCPSACVNVRSCFALAHIRGSMRFDSAMAKGHVAGSDSAFAGFAREASFNSLWGVGASEERLHRTGPHK